MLLKVFFDVDGVIIQGWHADPRRRRAWDATIEADLGISREAFQRSLFRPKQAGAEPLMNACLRGAADLKAVLAEVLPLLGYRGSVDGFLDYWFRKDSRIDPEVLDVVARIRACEGAALFLATGQEHHRAAYLWKELGLSEAFDDIFYSARLGVDKDSADFFAKINAELHIAEGERPLFFDDRESIVARARAAGWDAQLFSSVEDLLQNQAADEAPERLRGFGPRGPIAKAHPLS